MRPTLFSLLLFFCLLVGTHAQEFAFELIFEDNAGNLDTLMLGYDSLATDSVDAAFGEANVVNEPFKPGLDVRVKRWSTSAWMIPPFN